MAISKSAFKVKDRMRKQPGHREFNRRYRPRTLKYQNGAVLLVVLLLLLLTTIVGYQAMETSSLETRMAVAREGKELSFQAVESMIAELKNDGDLLSQAYINALVGGGAASLAAPMDLPGGLEGDADVHFRDAMLPKGYAATIGANTLRSIRFELRARVGLDNDEDRFDSEHIQGIKRLTPFVQQ